MSFKHCIYLMTTILSICVGASAAAHAESYPWCTQGDVLRCYYMNREQCEETVDYHGFCVVNPDYHRDQR